MCIVLYVTVCGTCVLCGLYGEYCLYFITVLQFWTVTTCSSLEYIHVHCSFYMYNVNVIVFAIAELLTRSVIPINAQIAHRLYC